MKSVSFRFAALVASLFLGAAQSALSESAESKAWRINVPVFELRGASIEESIRALSARSRALDPSHEGVNFVWPASLPADTRLNLRLVNVPLREVARYVARLSGMRLTAEQNALIFMPLDGPSPPVAARFSPAVLAAEELILPRVEFRDATLPAALDYLQASARAADPRKTGANVVVDLPADAREARISLSLTNVPFGEALHYAASLVDLVVIEESYALIVTADAKHPTPPSEGQLAARPVPQEPNPALGWRNPLFDPPQAASRGSAYRDMNGDIQQEKSGYVPRRSMGGFPQPLDPDNRLDPENHGK